jgi:hypothetical protein
MLMKGGKIAQSGDSYLAVGKIDMTESFLVLLSEVVGAF